MPSDALDLLDVTCFGHVTLDYRYLIDTYPVENKGAYVDRRRVVLGGDAAIIASNLSLFGLNVGLIGNGIGNDNRGNKIRNLLSQRKIEAVLDNFYHKTPYIIVMVSTGGSRTWFARGMSNFLERDPNTYDLSKLQRSRLVYVDSWFQAAAARAVDIGKEKRVPIVLHAGPWTQENILQGVDIVVRSSSDYAYHEKLEDLLTRDLDKGTKLTIITEGPRGCIFGTSNGFWKLAGHTVPMVDTTGAGATFTSGILFGYSEGVPLELLPALANAIAAIKVSMFGNLTKLNIDKVTQLARASTSIPFYLK